MFIFGLKCIFCGNALNTLGIESGVMSTRCTGCGHVSNPKPKDLSQNVVYSKFANKKIEVQYSAKRPRSGEYRKVSIHNQNDIYPDRKAF